MPSQNEMIAHVKTLEEVIEYLRDIHDTKNYDHKVTDNTHLATVYCNNAIEALYVLIGEQATKGVKNQ
jgi:hypothetical protein